MSSQIRFFVLNTTNWRSILATLVLVAGVALAPVAAFADTEKCDGKDNDNDG